MSSPTLLVTSALLLAALCACRSLDPTSPRPIAFAVYASQEPELSRLEMLVESLRTFGGRCADAPVWVFVPGSLEAAAAARLAPLGEEVTITACEPLAETAWYYLAGKVAAAALAEERAEGQAAVLALLDADTIFLDEPAEFLLPEGKSLGWRTVFHRNIQPLWDEPLDDYWSRVYELCEVEESDVFPMVTPADGERIRPYFQAGCVVVRPERGFLRAWTESFALLGRDPEIRDLSEANPGQRTFTFQAALAGTLMTRVSPAERIPLSDRINYPVFFREMFGASRDFHDLNGAATIRYEYYFDDPPVGWDEVLQGPADRLAWLRERFPPAEE